MVELEQQMGIKKAVVEYLMSERKERNVNNIPLHEILGSAEATYLERLQEGVDWYEASEEAEKYVTRMSSRAYEKVRSFSDNKYLNDDELVEEVISEIGNQLRIFFREDRQRMESIIKRKPLSREEMYIEHVKDLVGLLPSHVFTDFVLDRDVQVFIGQAHGAYLRTNDRELRSSTYFKLLYATLDDPFIYRPEFSDNLDRKVLDKLLFQYIIGDRRVRDTINLSQTTDVYYENIIEWNNNTNHNIRLEGDFKKSFLGAIVVNNNIYPEARKTKVLADTLQRLFKAKDKYGKKEEDMQRVVAKANKELQESGACIIEINEFYFIVGKELYVVEKVHNSIVEDSMVIRNKYALSNVTNKVIEKYLK